MRPGDLDRVIMSLDSKTGVVTDRLHLQAFDGESGPALAKLMAGKVGRVEVTVVGIHVVVTQVFGGYNIVRRDPRPEYPQFSSNFPVELTTSLENLACRLVAALKLPNNTAAQVHNICAAWAHKNTVFFDDE